MKYHCIIISALVLLTGLPATSQDLRFNPQSGYETRTMSFLDGSTVTYRAYENIEYVLNPEDVQYQSLNIYVPMAAVGASKGTPILLRNNVGGYMAAAPRGPEATDASGRALKEGYVLCIPGTRGANSTIDVTVGKGKKSRQETIYTGRAPKALLDLKAVVRYLRYNDDVIPGDAELIFSDGTSAGGAMSSLLGATGNHPVYEPYLQEMGAAPARDDIYACIAYCPITDLEHADMAYEWLYGCTNDGIRGLDETQKAVSEELAAAYPAYLNALGLTNPFDGSAITADNMRDYIKYWLIKSMQRARDEGAVIPDECGATFYVKPRGEGRPQGGPGGPGGNRGPGGPGGAGMGGPGPRQIVKEQGNIVTDIDMDKYLSYVVSTIMLKTPPAFDAMNVIGGRDTNENKVFGDAAGNSVNFTAYAFGKVTGNAVVPDDIARNVYMYNPLNFIGNPQAATAHHWFIRHGARDRDTSFNVPVTLATKLMNNGYDVDFFLPWNRPHSGDYNLDDLFSWIKAKVHK